MTISDAIGHMLALIRRLVPLILAWRAGRDAERNTALQQGRAVHHTAKTVANDVARLSDAAVAEQLRTRWTRQ